MVKTLTKLALSASIMFALTFTISCGEHYFDELINSGSDDSSSSVKGGGDSSPSENSSSSVKGGEGSSPSKNSSSSGTNLAVEKGTFKDSRDDQTYNWVKIGTQTWMAQNLNYFEPWVGPTRGNKCYDSKDANCEKYGRLYEWDDAIRVCPDGWHLPTKAEWETLISFAGGKDAGKKLKARSDWREGAGTDDYGFKALPGGFLDDEFQKLNTEGNWWTSTENVGHNWQSAYSKYMTATNEVQEGGWYGKKKQYSVRCIEGTSSSSSINSGSVTDKRDNQKYVTVKIGLQNWMAQNLNYAGRGVCYNNKDTNCEKYGRLYDWASAMNVDDKYNAEEFKAPPGQYKGLCPDGWHLPTKSEWNSLIDYVGASDDSKKLKTRSSEWGDSYGTNIYGFGALPGGFLDGEFQNLNQDAIWWTSTENGGHNGQSAYSKYMTVGNNDIGEGGWYGKKKQYSVRCVED